MGKTLIEWDADNQRAMYKEGLEKNKAAVLNWSNVPGHAHRYPGIWDWDNAYFAGTVCEQCRRWNKWPELEKAVDDWWEQAEKLRIELTRVERMIGDWPHNGPRITATLDAYEQFKKEREQ